MKKLFVLVLALLLSISVFAEGISREEALQYARRFFSDTPKAALDIVWEGDHADNPAFYVINREGGGFLILSGEMAVNPLLGYSYTGTFRTQGMPVHMKDWFGGLERDINHVREMKSVPKEKVLREWEALGVRTKAGGTEHVIESAQWDQGAPYNKYCPTGSNGHKCVTGCVATAMAIVLRHNMYPAHGYGELRTYTTSSQKIYVEGYSILHRGPRIQVGHDAADGRQPCQYRMSGADCPADVRLRCDDSDGLFAVRFGCREHVYAVCHCRTYGLQSGNPAVPQEYV